MICKSISERGRLAEGFCTIQYVLVEAAEKQSIILLKNLGSLSREIETA